MTRFAEREAFDVAGVEHAGVVAGVGVQAAAGNGHGNELRGNAAAQTGVVYHLRAGLLEIAAVRSTSRANSSSVSRSR